MGATDKANETVLDDKLENMTEDVDEMEPASEITPAETDEKEVSVISDRKTVSSDGKDDLVSQLPQDFIGPTVKTMDLPRTSLLKDCQGPNSDLFCVGGS